MLMTGRYSRCESSNFDLEEEINFFVDKVKELLKEVNQSDATHRQEKLILKAMATTIIDKI